MRKRKTKRERERETLTNFYRKDQIMNITKSSLKMRIDNRKTNERMLKTHNFIHSCREQKELFFSNERMDIKNFMSIDIQRNGQLNSEVVSSIVSI